MTMQETLEQIRLKLGRWVREHDASQAGLPCEESLLLKNGKLHGCRFSIGAVSAVWILGESTMEVRAPGQSDTLVVPGSSGIHRAA